MTEQKKTELIEMIKKSIRSITADVDIDRDYLAKVYRLFHGKIERGHLNNRRAVLDVLEQAVYNYDGDTKTPPVSFWVDQVKNKIRTLNVGNFENIYKQPSPEERVEMSKIAEQTMRMLGGGDDETKTVNPLSAKIARYREYSRRGLVRIDSRGSVYNQQWVSKEIAVNSNLNYHCPDKWLSKRVVQSSF